MQEIWKEIEGLENLYEVSNLGRIRSLPRIDIKNRFVKAKILKQSPNLFNYMCVRIKKRTLQVHRIVAKTFVPNPLNKSQVNHIDGNKKNNCADNLEWTTNQENCQKAYDMGLTTLEWIKVPIAKLVNGVEVVRYDSMTTASQKENITFSTLDYLIRHNKIVNGVQFIKCEKVKYQKKRRYKDKRKE